MVLEWANLEIEKAKTRAETNLEKVLGALPDDAATYDHIKSGLYLAAAPALTAASLLAIPTLFTFATFSTTSFFVFTTSTFAIPTLVVGTGGLIAANLLGWKALDHLQNRAKQKLTLRMLDHARKAVFGYGLPPETPYLLNNMQALILKASKQELEILD